MTNLIVKEKYSHALHCNVVAAPAEAIVAAPAPIDFAPSSIKHISSK